MGMGNVFDVVLAAIGGNISVAIALKVVWSQYQKEKKARAMAEEKRIEEAKEYMERSHEFYLKLNELLGEFKISNKDLLREMKHLSEDVKNQLKQLQEKIYEIGKNK